jgi:hypothetical protein
MPNVPARRPVPAQGGDSLETPGCVLRGAETVRAVTFFGLLFAYLWLVVRPELIYACGTITNFPVFQKGWSFFAQSVRLPGGLVQYVSAFASQIFYYSWAGAAVIAVQAWAICVCTGYLLRKTGLPGARLLAYVPAILIAIAYAQYSYHLPLFMAALASLAFASLYARLSDRSGRDVGVYGGLALVLHLIGAGAVVPFAALCIVYELRQRQWRRAGLYLLVGLVLPYIVGVLAFRISFVNAYTELLPVSWRVFGWSIREKMLGTVYGVYLVPILGMTAGGLWSVLCDRQQEAAAPSAVKQPKKGQQPRKGALVRLVASPAVRWSVGTLVLLVAGGVAAVSALDAEKRAQLAVHNYACRRMWPEVLAASRRCPSSLSTMNAVNRALYHSGRLGADMFRYVQQPDGLLITGEDHAVMYWHVFDTLIELGLANRAENNLTECLEVFGEQPWILERLATVNEIKGRTAAARIFWGAMTRTLFHDDLANERLARLDADPNTSDVAALRRVWTASQAKDVPAEFYAKEVMLAALVSQEGSSSRMAFEYLTAWYLLTGQLPKVVKQIEKLGQFGYTEIPPLWQEAILIHAYGTGKPVDLRGRTISPELHKRIQQFSSVVNRHGRNRDAAMAELARDYAGSYFFYYFSTVLARR